MIVALLLLSRDGVLESEEGDRETDEFIRRGDDFGGVEADPFFMMIVVYG